MTSISTVWLINWDGHALNFEEKTTFSTYCKFSRWKRCFFFEIQVKFCYWTTSQHVMEYVMHNAMAKVIHSFIQRIYSAEVKRSLELHSMDDANAKVLSNIPLHSHHPMNGQSLQQIWTTKLHWWNNLFDQLFSKNDHFYSNDEKSSVKLKSGIKIKIKLNFTMITAILVIS